MQTVDIRGLTYHQQLQEGSRGQFRLSLHQSRRYPGWRGWLGRRELLEVAWLDVGEKGADQRLCQEQQGLFALTRLHVHPEFRGLGLGTHLINEGVRQARRRGAILAGLLDGEQPEKLLNWFLKKGMDIVRRDDQPWVLARRAKAARASVTTTRLVLADQWDDLRPVAPSTAQRAADQP